MTHLSLGNALLRFGERECAPARLAVAAYSEAVQELTCARAPLQWAGATGNQGVVLMQLAKRRGDEEMAKLAGRSESRSRPFVRAAMRDRPPFMRHGCRMPAPSSSCSPPELP